jgi:multicomponent Na+:H+ antiporter subunit E
MKFIGKTAIRIYRGIKFILFYLMQLIKANMIIAKDILSKNPNITPGFIEIEIEAKRDSEILALVNLISMTPGTLCLDISEDKKYIYVHDMYLKDIASAKQNIKNGLEKKILEITR